MRLSTLLLGGLALASCASTPEVDRSLLREHAPRSVLVLPPRDATLEVDAACAYLATVSRPLAEQGYYVFPVAVVDRLLRDNGLPGPGEMHEVPLAHLGEVFGADAVLYLTLEDWGTAFRVFESRTSVTVSGRLVDVATGLELWRGSHTEQAGSSASTNPLAMVVNAVVHQVVSSVSDPSVGIARRCNEELLCDDGTGLLRGPLHEDEERGRVGAGSSASAH